MLTSALFVAEFVCELPSALALLHITPIKHVSIGPEPVGAGGLFISLIEFDWVID